jgi:hypothetical protein
VGCTSDRTGFAGTETKVFSAVMMSAFFVALAWVFVPALPRFVGKISMETLLEGVPEMLVDESGIPVIICLLLFIALVAVLRFIVQLIADLLSGELGGGPQTLRLK